MASATSSAPTFPCRASRSDILVNPETSPNTMLPSTSRQRGIEVCPVPSAQSMAGRVMYGSRTDVADDGSGGADRLSGQSWGSPSSLPCSAQDHGRPGPEKRGAS